MWKISEILSTGLIMSFDHEKFLYLMLWQSLIWSLVHGYHYQKDYPFILFYIFNLYSAFFIEHVFPSTWLSLLESLSFWSFLQSLFCILYWTCVGGSYQSVPVNKTTAIFPPRGSIVQFTQRTSWSPTFHLFSHTHTQVYFIIKLYLSEI